MTRFSFSRLGIFGFFFRSNAAARRATRFTFRSLGIARRSAGVRRTASRAVEPGSSRRGREAHSPSSSWTRFRPAPRRARGGGFLRRGRTNAGSRRQRRAGRAGQWTRLGGEPLENRALLAATTPPSSIVLTPVGGTVIANSLNVTNTHLQLQAAIAAGEATGGKAEFYVGTTKIGTDAEILAGDTKVTFDTSDGTPTAKELQALIASGGVVSVKLIDSVTPTPGSVTSVVNATLAVDYTPLVAEQGTTKLVDGKIDIAEAVAPTTFRVWLPSSVVVGNTVDLLLGGLPFAPAKTATLTGTDVTNGFVDFTVTTADLGGDGVKSLTARLTTGMGDVTGAALSFILNTKPAFTSINGGPMPAVNSRATPISSIEFTLATAATPVLADDIELFYSSPGGGDFVIPLPDVPGTYNPEPAITGNGTTIWQIKNLSEPTKAAGTYILTYSKDGITFSYSWVMTVVTPGELTATPSLLPTEALPPNTPRSKPVDSVQFVFTEGVTGVDVQTTGTGITQFELRRGGVKIDFPASATVTGGGDTYFVNGLAPVTATNGSYQLLLKADPTIKTYAGGQLLAPVSMTWEYRTKAAVSSFSLPSSKTYKAGDILTLVATFSDTVDVGGIGTPSIDFTLGAAPKTFAYVGGTGTNQLSFAYTIANNDVDTDGIQLTNSIRLNGATLNDAYVRPATLQFTAPDASGIKIDGQVPTASPVAPTAKLYKTSTDPTIGKITFTVPFSEVVNVTGTPSLQFALGSPATAAIRQATYLSGTGTSTLTFEYTITDADQTATGITIQSLTLNGGTIQDAAGNNTDPTQNFSLAASGVIINRTGITGLAVTPKTNPAIPYKVGEVIEFVATFSNAVTVTGAPRIQFLIDSSGTAKTASYVSGNGTTTLKFRYAVAVGDLDTNGIDLVSALIDLNGGTIVDASSTAAALTFSLPATSGVLVDGVAPTIAIGGVTTPPVNTYTTTGANNKLTFAVTFSEIVNVTGAPKLTVTIGGVTRQVALAATSGTGTTTLNFEYPIDSSDSTITGVTVTGIALSGGTIQDVAGNDATLTPFTAVPSAAFAINRTGITGFTVTPKYYKLGDVLEFDAKFSNVVTVTGTPRIQFLIDSSGTAKTAIYVAGNGTTTLKFRSTVAVGDLDTNGIDLVSAVIDLNGGTIKDASTTDAALAFSMPTTTGVLVDGVVPTLVLTPPGANAYATGDVLTFVATTSEAVTVTGSPTIALTVGVDARVATYNAGLSTSTSLVFQYTVAANDSANGITIGAISVGLGSIRDAALNDANTAHTASGAGIVVNPTVLQTLDLTSQVIQTYRVGDFIEFTATFNLPVTVTGTPTLPLTIGTVPRNASYISGTGTSQIKFRYTVVSGDFDNDGIEFAGTTIGLVGATIVNKTVPATVAFTPPNVSGVKVDAVVPTLNSVTGPAAGTYREGDWLRFTATFSESMIVTPAGDGSLPRIAVVIGNNTRYATYLAGNETPILVFGYQVASGEVDSDGVVASSVIQLNNSRITDLAGNSNVLTFPFLNTTGVLVDAAPPSVTRFSVPITTPNGIYTVGAAIPIIATLSESVLAGSTIEVTLDTGAMVMLTTGVNGTTLTGNYIVALGENSTDLTVTGFTDVNVTDLGGNPLGSTTVPTGANNIAGLRAIVIDTAAPTAPVAPVEQGTTKLLDGILNSAEAATSTTFRVGLGASGATAGDMVELLLGGASFTTPNVVTLAAGDVTNGYVDFTVSSADLGADGSKSLTARVTDQAGNGGVAGPAITFLKDTAAPTAPNTPIEQGTTKVADGFLNSAEAATNTIFRVGLGTSGAAVGDAVELLLDGAAFTTQKIVTLVAADITRGYVDFTVSSADLGADGVKSLTAKVTDQAGNASPASTAITFTKDTLAPTAPNAPTEQGTTKLVDGILNGAEAATSMTFRVGLGTSGAAAGDRVELLLGGASFTTPKVVTLAAGDVTNGYVDFTVSSADLGADGTKSLTARVTNSAGNPGTPSPAITFLKDTAAPTAPTLALGSGVANGATQAEATQGSGVITVTGENGAAITVTFTRGPNTVTKMLTGTGAAQAVVLTTADVTTLGDGLVTVSAVQTDAAGNPQTAPDATTSFTLDTVAPTAPALALGSGVADGATQAEATQASGVVIATGESGATITVTFTRGPNTITKTLTGTNAGQAVTLTAAEVVALGDGGVNVSAVQTDASGNPQTVPAATTSFTLDTAAPVAPTLALGSGVANGATQAEATQASGVVVVTGEVGVTISVTFTRGLNTVTKTLTGTGATQAVVLAAADVTTLGNGVVSVSAGQTDGAGNTSAAGTTSFTLDTLAPTVANVTSSTPNGTYKAGSTISIQVRFSESVIVTGSPTLALNVGRSATFASVSGNTITFNYIVQVGDSTADLDYASTTALALNGGTIRDAAGNNAVRTLPAPGAAGSLGANKAIVIDGIIRATALGLGTTPPGPVYNNSTINLTFSSPVTGVTVNSFRLYYQNRSVSLAGAVVRGSGTSWQLVLPTKVLLNGNYRLDIGGPTSGIASGGVPMSTVTSLYWRRG